MSQPSRSSSRPSGGRRPSNRVLKALAAQTHRPAEVFIVRRQRRRRASNGALCERDRRSRGLPVRYTPCRLRAPRPSSARFCRVGEPRCGSSCLLARRHVSSEPNFIGRSSACLESIRRSQAAMGDFSNHVIGRANDTLALVSALGRMTSRDVMAGAVIGALIPIRISVRSPASRRRCSGLAAAPR